MLNKKIIILLLLTVYQPFCTLAAEPEPWKGITVVVKTNQPIETKNSWKKNTDGFDYLSISLTNKGNSPIIIENITIRIPLTEKLEKGLDMFYGGSCMGRTPLLRQNVDIENKMSSSHMYEMIRLKNSQYIFAGSVSWRTFMPNFTQKDGALLIFSDGEGKQIKSGQTIQYEQIVLKKTNNWIETLNQFGTAIANENKISKIKKVDFKGWATWDYYGFKFSTNELKANMIAIKKIYPTANLFQVDAGWSTVRGDNTSIRADLEGGMKAIADLSKAAGMTPGIWIDGFRADSTSEIFKKHPEYFLRDQNNKIIVETKQKTDEVWNHVFFDYSHPDARGYMAENIRIIKEVWGFRYFKIDFMRFGLNQQIRNMNPSVKKIKAFDTTITDLERMRLGLSTMRKAIGQENYFLGCSAVFAPCIGFVDGMRTAGDINPNYDAFSERVLGNAGNFYLKKVFNVDADYLVFRTASDEDNSVSQEAKKHGGNLTLNEAKMWADFNKLYGNCRLSSDNLISLRPERIDLIKEVFKYPPMDETVPLDAWQHAKNKYDGFELIIAYKGKDIYLGVFNWGEKPKEYALQSFGISKAVHLEGRNSLLLKYEGKDTFKELCQKLQSK